MFCFRCGANMPETATVCPQCATPVQAAPQAAPPTPPQGAPVAQPQYTQPYYSQPYGQQPQTDGKATASLILGILSILCFSIFAGIPAVILGHMSRSNINKSMGRLTGAGMALAGLILGYVSIAWLPIMAAVMIPNLLRARNSANEAAAASNVRTINTAQVTYSTAYPNAGYASGLAILGGAPCSEGSAEKACLLDNTIACPQGVSGVPCYKDGYRFTLTGIPAGCGSEANQCTDYVIFATPLSSATGTKDFCSTSEAIVHSRRAYAAPSRPITTVEGCQNLQSL